MRRAILMLLAACGGPPSSSPVAATAAASSIATAADPSDVIVARVNGRPVWASCVAAQRSASSSAIERAADPQDVRSSLDECIAFELLAQEAERRLLATAPDVIDATRSALVNRLVETGFEQRFTKPADFGSKMGALLAQNAWRMDRPELRGSTYARITMDAKVAPELDAKGHALADKIYAALANESGVLPATLVDVATQVTAGSGLTMEHADPPLQPHASLAKPYADALFALPEVGRVSRPVRTQWGWDVILYADGLPAQRITRDVLAAQAFPEFRRAQFTSWVNAIVKQLDLKVTIDLVALERAEQTP